MGDAGGVTPEIDSNNWFDPDAAAVAAGRDPGTHWWSTGPKDERLTVTDTDVRPLNSICRLSDGGALVATATAIGGRRLLTAAHNLISTGGGSIWTAAPAYDRKDLYPPIAAVREIAHPRWLADADPAFDVGILVVASSAPHSIGVGSWTDDDRAARIYVSGYDEGAREVQKFGRGRFGTVAGNLVAHTCDTRPGQSGAPVLAYGAGPTRLVGVHAYGYADCSDVLPGAVNKAVRMTGELRGWIAAQME